MLSRRATDIGLAGESILFGSVQSEAGEEVLMGLHPDNVGGFDAQPVDPGFSIAATRATAAL